MLSSVEVSRTNGADITTGKSKEVLVSKLSFDYSIAVGDIANNTDASLTAQQSTITTHPYQKQYVFQLSKIVEIPVNSANGNNPVSGFNINAAPTTHFSYNDISMAAGLDSVGGRRLNASAYVITSIVDRLGGKTEYEYVESPSNRIITSLYTLPVGGFTLPATIFNSDIQMGKPISMTGVISVSKKIIIDQNQNKDWEYTYSNGPKYSYNSPINLGNHFEDGATKWDGGFVITTVKEPLINSNPNRVRSEYTHYTDEQSRLLFGKLKKVQSRDAGNALLDQKEYEYFANVAYESGFYRDNNYDPTTNPNNLVDNYYDINTRQYYTGNYGDYANFSNGDVQIIPAPINGNSSATINFTGTEIGDMLYLEQATPALFYARYLNSYFIPISKEKNSNYDIQIASPVLAALTSSSVPFSSSGSVRQMVDILSSSSSTIPRYRSVLTSQTTEFEYWDANSMGVSSSNGYRVLNGNGPTSTFELFVEPSWELYKKKSYSNELPNAYSTEEYFYFHDLRNTVGNMKDTLTNFYALNLSGGYKIRNLPYEVRTTTKSQGYNPISKSNYYWYDNRFFTSSDFTVDETLAYNPGLVCLTPDPPPGGPTPPNPTCIAELPGHQIPVGYQLVIDSNTDRWWCPIDIYYGEERSYLPHNPYEQPGEERLQLPERNLKGKLFLRHTSVQVDINPNDSLVYTSVDPGAAHILRFAYNATDQVHFPVYPYAKLVTNYVEERNIYGQVKLEHDGKGLKTLYEYDQEKTVFFQDATNNCNSHYAQIFTNIGLPNTVTVGETLPDELITTYSYYKDHSVEKIIDPNLLEMKYSYDEYGRLEKTYRNNILLSKNAYSYWDNVLTDNFDQRATKNYVETYTLNEANQLQAERSRAYIDPQGRKYEVLTQISPDYTSPSTYDTKMIYSGLTKYDNWNRSIKQFKAFKVSSASPVSFSPYFDPNQINNSVVSNQTQYENNQRSRALRASKYGEDIATGHTVNSSYILLKGHILASELGLNTTEQSMIIPGTASQYVFLKTSAIDEDGKKVVTYSDALGRTVASKTYLTNNSTAITLFVYNSLGQQRIIINPLKQQSVYEYNLLGQIYKKTTVDAGVVKYIYNSDGQVVLEEDANTRAGIDNSDVPYMRRYTYDAFGRLVKQEKVKNGGEDFQHPFYELSYSDDGNFFNAPDPQNSQVPYADYQLNPGFGLSSDFCFNLQHYQVIWAGSAWVYSSPYAYLTTVGIEKEFVYHNALPHATIGFINTQLQGWLSSSNQANLKGKLSYSLAYNNSNTKIKVTAYSYTTDGNLAYEASQFDKTGLSSSGGITQGLTYKTYNLRGSVKEIVIDDGLNGSPEMTFQYDYDGWNRLTNVYSLSNKIASYEYIDELGLVDRLKYFANGTSCNLEVDDIDYVYDQRDRLTNINSHLFSQSLYYDNNLPSTGNSVYDVVAHQNYNGNINAIKINYHASSASNYSIMGSSMDGATYYGYSYDGMNRLTRADASVMNVLSNPVSTNPALKYGDEQLTYDKIGNITTLRRGLYYLPTNPTPANIIENWRYKYITGTNKLYQIVENVVPFTNQVANYTYDANGSLRTDDKKLLTSSTYGRANLPVSIVANGKNLSYLYNANDNRIYKENITDNTSEYYLQDFSGRTLGIYDFSSSQWTWYAFGKDRIAKIGTSSNEYYETDHLGNTRVTYTPTVNCTNSTITYSINNATDYFAYGKILRSFESTDEKYRFTGKERDNETELDYFEARFLDTDIARFLSLDPLQMEFMNYSPYNYVLGNPIGLIDLDGRKPKDPMAGYYAATMNSRTFGFSTRHPLIAINIGSVSSGSTNISTNVVRFATRIGLKENVQHEGSEVNAFRHTLWQSSITVNYGDKIAKEIGNAHEENPFVDLSKRTFVGKNALSQADQTADMLNNEIGRNIGKANPKANMKELALKTLEYQYKVGLYTAVAGDNGVINVKQTKISEEQYNAGVETINGLNNMGYNKSEQEKINSEALKDWQNRYVEP